MVCGGIIQIQFGIIKIIILTEEEAIRESIRQPNARVDIFSKNDDVGYSPSYNYKNGKKCTIN